MHSIKKLFSSTLVRSSGIAALDQAMLSTVNFVISAILLKAVTKAEYGYYSIAFSVSLFLISLQNAVVTTPLSVLLTTKKGEHKDSYVAALGVGQFIVLIPAVLLCLLVVAIGNWYGLDNTMATTTTAVSFASIGLLFREYLRAYFFAEESPASVMKLDSIFTATYLLITLLILLSGKISVAIVFLSMGTSAFLVSVILHRRLTWKFNIQSIRESYRENWRFGKWALLGVVVTHIQKYCYIYLLGALIGSMAVADVSASRLLLMPLLLIQTGWDKVVRPHGARLREERKLKRFFKEQVAATLIITVLIAIYILLLTSFSGFLAKFLFSQKYETALNYMNYWGAIFTIGFAGLNASIGLQVTMNFKSLANINIVTMLLTISSGYFLIKQIGVAGGLLSLIIGESILTVWLWVIFTSLVFPNTRRNWHPLQKLADLVTRRASWGKNAN